jgi:hypothetical protein
MSVRTLLHSVAGVLVIAMIGCDKPPDGEDAGTDRSFSCNWTCDGRSQSQDYSGASQTEVVSHCNTDHQACDSRCECY